MVKIEKSFKKATGFCTYLEQSRVSKTKSQVTQLHFFKEVGQKKCRLYLEKLGLKAELFSYSQEQVHLWPRESQLFYLKTLDVSVAGDMPKSRDLVKSSYAQIRDRVGAAFLQVPVSHRQNLQVHFWGVNKEELKGAILGLGIAVYKFKATLEAENIKSTLQIFSDGKEVAPKEVKAAANLADSVNCARHLVNLPANLLTPSSFAGLLKNIYRAPGFKVEVWDVPRLKKENMGLLLAVGQAAKHTPCLVHIAYRPSGKKSKKGPMAFVGKGITFDSGGLDIKPSQAMRFMKKDMGGAAAVCGLAYWVLQTRPSQAIDFYIPLAENSVSSDAFRPGDILWSRSGQSVEIHNTDAEGRLILADALDVAVTNKEKPQILVDIATLTGAIKVGLGAQVAGLFSNDNHLTSQLLRASEKTADFAWPMPLFQAYRSSMTSPVADMTNAVDGFGGAITAALFLESFVSDCHWAHLDIYAWKDAPEGSFAEAGGNGQAVQLLVEFISQLK